MTEIHSDKAELKVSQNVFEMSDFTMEQVMVQEKVSNRNAPPPQSEDRSIASKSEFLKNLSPEHQAELNHLIEDVVSNTVKNTLQEIVPDVVKKIIQEEIKK